MAELRELMRTGHVLSQDGRIQLSKTLDTQWQSQVMELYERLRAVFAEEFGHDLFFIYGTLLGAVREGGFIGHDIDFDAAYVSDERSGPAAGRELAAVALRLIELGYEVEIHTTALHVTDPRRPGDRVDVFHTWFDTGGVLRFPWGVAGTSVVTEAEWSGTREIDFPPGRGLVPVQAEAVVECLYGADWRRPKPGFSWVLAQLLRPSQLHQRLALLRVRRGPARHSRHGRGPRLWRRPGRPGIRGRRAPGAGS